MKTTLMLFFLFVCLNLSLAWGETSVTTEEGAIFLEQGTQGHFVVRNEQDSVIADVIKNEGEALQLGIQPGIYSVELSQNKDSLIFRGQLEPGQIISVHDIPQTLAGIQPVVSQPVPAFAEPKPAATIASVPTDTIKKDDSNMPTNIQQSWEPLSPPRSFRVGIGFFISSFGDFFSSKVGSRSVEGMIGLNVQYVILHNLEVATQWGYVPITTFEDAEGSDKTGFVSPEIRARYFSPIGLGGFASVLLPLGMDPMERVPLRSGFSFHGGLNFALALGTQWGLIPELGIILNGKNDDYTQANTLDAGLALQQKQWEATYAFHFLCNLNDSKTDYSSEYEDSGSDQSISDAGKIGFMLSIKRPDALKMGRHFSIGLDWNLGMGSYFGDEGIIRMMSAGLYMNIK